MATKPVSYESLKLLLLYLEANKRFQLSLRCSSIRATERMIPLRIDDLSFSQGNITVNKTQYEVGIYRKYHVGETPEQAKDWNRMGGVNHEVNKFGMIDLLDLRTLTPGDLDLSFKPAYTERTSSEMAQTLARQKDYYPRRKHRSEHCKMMIEHINNDLLCYQNQRKNAPVPYEHFIQLTIRSTGGNRIEWYSHNKPYRDAMKQLAILIFGGRREAISVKHFDFYWSRSTIRLPTDVTFRIQKLSPCGYIHQFANQLSQIMSDHPLDIIRIEGLHMEDVNHPFSSKSKILEIEITYFDRHHISDVLKNLTHRRVNLDGAIFMRSENLIDLIESWIEKEHPIGMHWSLIYNGKRYISRMYKEIIRHFAGAIIREGTVTIPMTNTSQIEFSYTKDMDSTSETCVLNMMVTAVNWH